MNTASPSYCSNVHGSTPAQFDKAQDCTLTLETRTVEFPAWDSANESPRSRLCQRQEKKVNQLDENICLELPTIYKVARGKVHGPLFTATNV